MVSDSREFAVASGLYLVFGAEIELEGDSRETAHQSVDQIPVLTSDMFPTVPPALSDKADLPDDRGQLADLSASTAPSPKGIWRRLALDIQ